jgi:RecQ-mediated genome instability protein 1
LADQLQISPHETKRLTDATEDALLDSDLSDSMQPGTGFPEGIATAEDLTVQGPSILVQIVDITEIGHSAFSLTNVRQTRLDQEDLAGLARQNEEDENQEQVDEDAGPIPKYPRSMLKLQLSDGTVTLPAIEFKKVPGLELGVTPLGCKVIVSLI